MEAGYRHFIASELVAQSFESRGIPFSEILNYIEEPVLLLLECIEPISPNPSKIRAPRVIDISLAVGEKAIAEERFLGSFRITTKGVFEITPAGEGLYYNHAGEDAKKYIDEILTHYHRENFWEEG